MGNRTYETGTDEELKQGYYSDIGYSDTGYDTDRRIREKVERIN